jgi:transcriptional antiterminator RfaH
MLRTARVVCPDEVTDIVPLDASPSGRLARWFLVMTKVGNEAHAQAQLERQGYCVYYPRLRQPKLFRGRWVDRVVGLFPRYLFLQVSPAQCLAPVRSTRGVSSVVRFGSQYAMVPDEIVRDLERRADPVSGLHRLNRERSFDADSAVRVIAGAFNGLDGVFQREAGDERVVVLLELLGLPTRVLIPAQFVVGQLSQH